jgi:hypothetical protein
MTGPLTAGTCVSAGVSDTRSADQFAVTATEQRISLAARRARSRIVKDADVAGSALTHRREDHKVGRRQAAQPPVVPFLLSATTREALRERASRLRSHLATSETNLADAGFTLATGRSRFDCRAAVVATDRDTLFSGLDAIAAGTSTPGVVTGTARPDARPVLVFPGQGTQWTGMAVDLLGSSPVFAARMTACQDALKPFVDWTLTEVLADETALARVVALRSKAIHALSGLGEMTSVALSRQEAERRILPWQGRISLAAANGPGVHSSLRRARPPGRLGRDVDGRRSASSPAAGGLRVALRAGGTAPRRTPHAARADYWWVRQMWRGAS